MEAVRVVVNRSRHKRGEREKSGKQGAERDGQTRVDTSHQTLVRRNEAGEKKGVSKKKAEGERKKKGGSHVSAEGVGEAVGGDGPGGADDNVREGSVGGRHNSQKGRQKNGMRGERSGEKKMRGKHENESLDRDDDDAAIEASLERSIRPGKNIFCQPFANCAFHIVV